MMDEEKYKTYRKVKTLVEDESYYSKVLQLLYEGASIYLISGETKVRLSELLVDKDELCDKVKEKLKNTIEECSTYFK